MKRGFYTIMAAQFFSSLADNALFIAAIALLKEASAPDWQEAALVPIFALFYVMLAPFVGAFADALPKGRVMLISNTIKIVGCLMMLFGGHPLYAYAIVGLGAAAYSPAKYGILTELLPPSQLVKANGWIEGLTIASIILGVLMGGLLLRPRVAAHILGSDIPMISAGIQTIPEAAISVIALVYLVAAIINMRIPLTGVAMRPMPRNPLTLLPDFWHCNRRLWRDKLGQISLSTTTLFWGVSGNLRYIVLAWAALALGYNVPQASSLLGVVAIGTAGGAIWASLKTRLDKATGVLPLGIVMGLLVIGMVFVHDVVLAKPFLIVLGAIGGYLVVPMNALLQHRGHNLMGAGRSIAVQNFNEQLAILLIGAAYTNATKWGVSALSAIVGFGLLVAISMALIQWWHCHNMRAHRAEVEELLDIARNDNR